MSKIGGFWTHFRSLWMIEGEKILVVRVTCSFEKYTSADVLIVLYHISIWLFQILFVHHHFYHSSYWRWYDILCWVLPLDVHIYHTQNRLPAWHTSCTDKICCSSFQTCSDLLWIWSRLSIRHIVWAVIKLSHFDLTSHFSHFFWYSVVKKQILSPKIDINNTNRSR